MPGPVSIKHFLLEDGEAPGGLVQFQLGQPRISSGGVSGSPGFSGNSLEFPTSAPVPTASAATLGGRNSASAATASSFLTCSAKPATSAAREASASTAATAALPSSSSSFSSSFSSSSASSSAAVGGPDRRHSSFLSFFNNPNAADTEVQRLSRSFPERPAGASQLWPELDFLGKADFHADGTSPDTYVPSRSSHSNSFGDEYFNNNNSNNNNNNNSGTHHPRRSHPKDPSLSELNPRPKKVREACGYFTDPNNVMSQSYQCCGRDGCHPARPKRTTPWDLRPNLTQLAEA